MDIIIIYYLIAINFFSLVFFTLDKRKAKKNKRRIPEAFLHLLELLGGIIIIIPLMYFIRHKNKKGKYFFVSWLILALWIALFILQYKHI